MEKVETVGRHEHKGSWDVVVKPDERQPDVQHFIIHTCKKCGIVFVNKRRGPAPAQKE